MAIQGIGAASLIYFDKSAARLGLAESLALVLIPQSPLRRTPDRLEPSELRTARLRLFDRWAEERPQARSSADYVALPLHFGHMRDLPFGAPHFTNAVLGADRAESSSVLTTLDVHQQALIERVLAGYVRERGGVGIHNAAALLVDYRDLSVRAMIGSADFHSPEIQGQVDGTQAKRSPGSALKPFIYALAIDQGVIHPLSVLKDAPASFGTFSPENFDGRFVGPITASDSGASGVST